VARLELQEGLVFLSEHLHGLMLDGQPEFGTVSGIYGLERLPVRFAV
jgi:cytochrome P450